MTDRLLEIELQILILRYCRTRVEQALHTVPEGSAEDVGRAVAAETKRKAGARRGRDRVSTRDLIHKVFLRRPKSAKLAEEIVANFESRKFLPERRDAQLFLTRLDSPSHLKSRADAVGPLVGALAQMTDAELAQLSKASASPRTDDYLVLARQIMKGASTHRKQ